MKRIVAIGPESTGKSTLCQQLAGHFHTTWVPEYAREFLLQNNYQYSYEDLLHIAKGQVAIEDKIASSACPQTTTTSNIPLFVDTDLYVMKVWCEFVYDRCHQWILDHIATRKYDLYLLCAIDLPWVQDGLREYPDLESREKLYNMYKDILINQPVPWVEISGNAAERLNKAIEATNELLHQ